MRFIHERGDGHVITGWEPGLVRVQGAEYRQNLAICGDTLLEGWGPTGCAALTPADFAPLLEERPEVILLGTGQRLTFPPRALLLYFRDINIGLEVMDTPAACRTWNLLVNEGRRVAVALFV